MTFSLQGTAWPFGEVPQGAKGAPVRVAIPSGKESVPPIRKFSTFMAEGAVCGSG